jgi:hypothetical protein
MSEVVSVETGTSAVPLQTILPEPTFVEDAIKAIS